ncbi:hypothetical protein [Pseudomonas frederiksbergensis]|uniref:HPr kinase n=1 Tax=Pseudomonas frederiksbergensis TaxID=104087 RepID=A0A6L5C1C0_9PSED|nr:hypothetical protein [Pseudomonas frederiksbergensis]KAF2394408.1 hypothetical protein FX983_02389 [Pseudomonas frederiksbergensis]
MDESLDALMNVHKRESVLSSFSAVFDFMGTTLKVTLADAHTLNLFSAYVSPYFAMRQPEGKSPVRYTVKVNTAAIPAELERLTHDFAARAETMPWYFGATMQVLRVGDFRLARAADAGWMLFNASSVIVWCISDEVSALLLTVRLSREVMIAFSEHELLRIHGGFISFEQSGCLVLGGAGAGKTSLLINSLRHGGSSFCANDRSLVYLDGNRLTAHGSPIQSQVGEFHLHEIAELNLPANQKYSRPSGEIGFWSKMLPFKKASLSPRLLARLFDSPMRSHGRIDAVVIPRLRPEVDTAVSIEEIHHDKRTLLLDQVLNEDTAFPSSIFDLTAKPLPEPVISALCRRPWYFLNGYFNDGAVASVLENTIRRQPL